MFLDPTYSALAATVENIADAVTHARFVGTDQSSDGVVLMKIIQVLRTLIMNPEGSVLTNESVCEIMLSCFRICFEQRLNELLRRTAEHALKDMVLLLFMRLPQFSEDRQQLQIKKLKMRAGAMDQTNKKRKSKPSTVPIGIAHIGGSKVDKNTIPKVILNKTDDLEGLPEELQSPIPQRNQLKVTPLATTPATPAGNIVDMQGSISQTPTILGPAQPVESVIIKSDKNLGAAITTEEVKKELQEEEPLIQEDNFDADVEDGDIGENNSNAGSITIKTEEYINSMGVRFTQQSK